MSNCQKGEEEKDHSNSRKRKAEDRPPSYKSSNSIPSSASAMSRTYKPPDCQDHCDAYLFQRHPVMWEGTLHLKNDEVAVQMHFVSGFSCLARKVLPPFVDGQTSPLKITQRLKLEQQELYGVKQKLLLENEHCILVALPCGIDKMDAVMQSRKLKRNFISYFESKRAAGIVNITLPDEPGHVIHMFPACNFTNETLSVIAPCLLHLVHELNYLVVIITTLITAAPEVKPNPVAYDSDTPAPSA